MKPMFRKGRVPSDAEYEPVDIDVTPVMNVFIILFPFLISMSAFSHYAMLDFKLPPNVGVGLDASAGKPKLKLTALVAPTFVAITEGERVLDSIPFAADTSLAKFSECIAVRRSACDIKDEMVVAVRDHVPVQRVVSVMDRCRIAGFSGIGISSAPEDPSGGGGRRK